MQNTMQREKFDICFPDEILFFIPASFRVHDDEGKLVCLTKGDNPP